MTAPRDTRHHDPAPAAPFLHRHPWIMVAATFLALIAAWAILITIASRHRPERIPLEHLDPDEPPSQNPPAR